MRIRFCLAIGLFGAGLLHADTYTVTTTADSGAGSLRQAITDANGHAGPDSIAFAIVGSGVQTIVPLTPLPDITQEVVIDGYTQPGASENTNAPDQGSNAVLLIDLSGVSLPANSSAVGLHITGPDVTVRGLVVHAFFSIGFNIGTNGDRATIAGNFIGVDPAGAAWGGTQGYGVKTQIIDDLTLGGTAPADRNVIAGSATTQVRVQGGAGAHILGNLIGLNAAGTGRPSGLAEALFGFGVSGSNAGALVIGGTTAAERNVISGHSVAVDAPDGALIQGNFIGTNVTGTAGVSNKEGIQVDGDGVIIGGTAPGAGNVIAASSASGIDLLGDGAVIYGNFIGTDATGDRDLGNAPYGIMVNHSNQTIGGIGPGEGNVIAFNGNHGYDAGVYLFNGTGIRIRGNRIFENRSHGIDIENNVRYGPNANDDLDLDTGVNNLQNFPLVASVDYGATTTAHGTLDSAASTVFDLDFYANPACNGRPTLRVQGAEYVGSAQVTTDASGHAQFDVVLDQVLAAGQPVTAIATDPGGNSSEFSSGLLFQRLASSGVSTAGTDNQLYGQFFEVGGTLLVGGEPATDVNVPASKVLNAKMPARPPGSVSDMVLNFPSGSTGTLRNAWLAQFNDSASAGSFLNDVNTLVTNQIAVGVGGGNYGFADNIKRQQMAVFLLKAKHGICYVPPPCAGLFSDVTCPSTFANWIEAMANEGITGGCGAGVFCPESPVRRDQMAVFLLKADHGSDFVPPSCTGRFPDVACPSTFANWIEQLATEGVTIGCGGGNYCPLSNNTRGQMATFVNKTFNLWVP